MPESFACARSSWSQSSARKVLEFGGNLAKLEATEECKRQTTDTASSGLTNREPLASILIADLHRKDWRSTPL